MIKHKPVCSMVPTHGSLHSDPSFQGLLRRMNFPETAAIS